MSHEASRVPGGEYGERLAREPENLQLQNMITWSEKICILILMGAAAVFAYALVYELKQGGVDPVYHTALGLSVVIFGAYPTWQIGLSVWSLIRSRF